MFTLRAIVYSFIIYGILVVYGMNPENATLIKKSISDNVNTLPEGMLEDGRYSSISLLNSVYYNAYECSGESGSTPYIPARSRPYSSATAAAVSCSFQMATCAILP